VLYNFNISKLTASSTEFRSNDIFQVNSLHINAQYSWEISAHEMLDVNQLVGKQIRLSASGKIFCIATGELIKKSYQNGYSYQAFMQLPECDVCMVRPELCHFSKGTCRDEKWGMKHCFRSHIIYLANTGELKVGITRNSHYPARWMDQGAIQVLPLGLVADRLTAGLVEIELAKVMSDRTKWQLMLTDFAKSTELAATKLKLVAEFSNLFEQHQVELLPNCMIEINYPVSSYSAKLKSLSLDDGVVEGKLLGVKGQYFIFEHGVINIRKFQGYEITLEVG
jgi:hypothetical protein